MDSDVGSLAKVSTRRLVDHDAGVGKTEAFAWAAAAEEEGAHTSCLTDTNCGD